MSAPPMTKIFISHSSKDNEFAKQLAEALTGVGVDVWLDVSDIRLGANWSSEVQRGLDECDAMLVVITPEAMASKNVANEWQYYIDEDKPLFTIRWQPTKLHFQLRRLQYVDFHQQDFCTKFDEMCAKLQKQGFLTNAGRGEMHEMNGDGATPPPAEPKVQLSPPRIQRGEQTGLLRVEVILPPPFEWCEIPAGKVTLEEGIYLEEDTTFDLPGFAIGKYLITNAQYAKFIEAGGYSEQRWWTKSGWRRKEQEGWEEPLYWQDEQWNGLDFPVVGVSWYEAVAYCQWLNEATGAQPLRIMLPTEAQWQRAAQGEDGRAYPWGDEFDTNRCNTRASEIRHTTPVMQYPQGTSPYGVFDMGGNAYEWSLTAWETGEIDLEGRKTRCLRGGAWCFPPKDTLVSYGSYETPDSGRSNGIGFRICLLPMRKLTSEH